LTSTTPTGVREEENDDDAGERASGRGEKLSARFGVLVFVFV
jgi:hypothetical protein